MALFFSSRGNLKAQAMSTESSRRSSAQRRKSKKSVSFSDEGDTVRTTIHINDYSDQEISATWYNKYELQEIKNAIRDYLTQNNNNNNGMSDDSIPSTRSNKEESSFRGLESFTRYGSAQKRRNRQDAAMTVFDEQEGQLNYGIVDDEALALLYESCTRNCQAVAHSLALQDELEVQALNASPTISLSTTSAPPLQQYKSSSTRIIAVAGQQNQIQRSSKAAQAA